MKLFYSINERKSPKLWTSVNDSIKFSFKHNWKSGNIFQLCGCRQNVMSHLVHHCFITSNFDIYIIWYHIQIHCPSTIAKTYIEIKDINRDKIYVGVQLYFIRLNFLGFGFILYINIDGGLMNILIIIS